MMGGAVWWGRHAWQGACVAGETATAADGTYPAGMHSCLKKFGIFFARILFCKCLKTCYWADHNFLANPLLQIFWVQGRSVNANAQYKRAISTLICFDSLFQKQ